MYILIPSELVFTASLARIIVYSMAPDGMPAPNSAAPTPNFSPFGSGTSTPLPHNGGLGDYLSAPLGKGGHLKVKTYLAGSKALDALAKMIASTESFFHPTNSGSWTNDVCVSSFTAFMDRRSLECCVLNLKCVLIAIYTAECFYQVHSLRFQQT